MRDTVQRFKGRAFECARILRLQLAKGRRCGGERFRARLRPDTLLAVERAGRDARGLQGGIGFRSSSFQLRGERNRVEFGARDAFAVRQPVGRQHRRHEARARRQFVVGVISGAIAEEGRAAHRLDPARERHRDLAARDLRDRLPDRR